MIISLASINIWTLYLSRSHLSFSHSFSRISRFLYRSFSVSFLFYSTAKHLLDHSALKASFYLLLNFFFLFISFFHFTPFQLSLWHDLFFTVTYILCYTNRLRHRDRFPFLFYNLVCFFFSNLQFVITIILRFNSKWIFPFLKIGHDFLTPDQRDFRQALASIFRRNGTRFYYSTYNLFY